MLRKNFLGFHLIEILIVLAIVGILTLLAIPSYLTHITHQRRLEAEAILLRLAIAMEKYHIENNTYQDVTLANLQTKETIVENNYHLNIKITAEDTYELIARPQAQQAERDKDCGDLMLRSNGERNISGTDDAITCWS